MPQQQMPRFASPSPLLHLPDDLWFQLSRHLPPTSIFCLLQTNSRIHRRLRPLLPALPPHRATPSLRADAIVTAIRAPDAMLAAFLLHFAPPDTSASAIQLARDVFSDPILSHSLTPTVVYPLVRHLLDTKTSLLHLFSILEHCPSLSTILTVSAMPLAPSPHLLRLMAQLIHAKALQPAPDLAIALVNTYPQAASLTSYRTHCHSCSHRHTLLHVAAETGNLNLLRLVTTYLPEHALYLMNHRDCRGETPLSIAIRKRRSRVAQQLVRSGAEVRELVGCAARGGGRLEAADVWFKPVIDVD